MTRLTQKKKFQSPLCPGWSKRRKEKVWDYPRNPCWVQQWFRGVRRGVCWIESSYFIDKAFPVDPAFNKQNDRVVTLENDVFEPRWVSTNKHLVLIMMLDVVASIGGEFASVLVWMVLQVKICRLQRSSGDESFFIGQEDSLEITLRLPTGQNVGTHGKDCAGPVGRQHFWPNDFWPPQPSDLNLINFSLWMHSKKKGLQDTLQQRRWV